MSEELKRPAPAGHDERKKAEGSLIIIGGHEDRVGKKIILEEVAKRAKKSGDALVVVTVASQEPEELAKTYQKAFGELGVKHIHIMDIRTREEAEEEKTLEMLGRCSVVFFTGGDQLRITSQIGDTPVFKCMRQIYENGGTIVGTSAGAAAMPVTMLISGSGDESNKLSAIGMAPGLGFMENVVIDSHFAERGRMGRLLGAVSQNPKNLGIGIDEDTAIIVENGDHFRVLGSGAVYVVDGQKISYSSLSEKNPEDVLSVYNVNLHVLSQYDRFDLQKRQPTPVNGDGKQG
jgi:cyanophycinase